MLRTFQLAGLMVALALCATAQARDDVGPAGPGPEMQAGQDAPQAEAFPLAKAVAIVGVCLGAGLCAFAGPGCQSAPDADPGWPAFTGRPRLAADY